MAALDADIYISTQGQVVTKNFKANAAGTYYQGAVVFIDTGGGVQVVPAAGDMAIGISPTKQVVSASDEVNVIIFGVVGMPIGTNIAAADEGDLCCLDIGSTQSDNPADFVAAGDITPAANDTVLGRILRVTSSQMEIFIGPDTGKLYVATAGWGG